MEKFDLEIKSVYLRPCFLMVKNRLAVPNFWFGLYSKCSTRIKVAQVRPKLRNRKTGKNTAVKFIPLIKVVTRL